MTDIHSHILFGVDDGSKNIDESVSMLAAAFSAGITKIIATPHIRSADTDISVIRKNYSELIPYAKERGIDLRLGFECNTTAIDPNKFEEAKLFCFDGTSILLLEFPFENWPPYWDRIVYGLQSAGLVIIIAHPERYFPVRRDHSILDAMADMGCYFQINAGSINKKHGEKRKIVHHIEQMDKLDFIASDAHEPIDYEVYARIIKKYKGVNQTLDALNLD